MTHERQGDKDFKVKPGCVSRQIGGEIVMCCLALVLGSSSTIWPRAMFSYLLDPGTIAKVLGAGW